MPDDRGVAEDRGVAGDRTGSTVAPRLTGLASELCCASDEAVIRVTQVIDQLAERGDADRILDAVRPRLNMLRPQRPVGFARALFGPLQPLIVSTAEWRAAEATIPRGVIMPVADLVRSELPDVAAIDRLLAGGVPPGLDLWIDAASILARRAVSNSWNAPSFQVTGIRRQSLPFLVEAIRFCFAHRAALAPALADPLSLTEAVEGLMADAAQAGPIIWKLALTLLFEQTESPATLVQQVLALARRGPLGRDLEAEMHNVIAGVVGRLPLPEEAGGASVETLRDHAAAAARIVSFCTLRGEMSGVSSRLQQHGQELAQRTSTQLARGLQQATRELPEEGLPREAAELQAADRLEARLRALRSLDLATRPVSNGRDRDRMLIDAAREMSHGSGMDWLNAADRLRLCEILIGSEAALRLGDAR